MAAPDEPASWPETQPGDFPEHSRLRRWVAFSPSLRDRAAGASCRRTVACRTCGSVLGSTDDPVDAFLIALRHRREMRRRARQLRRSRRLGGAAEGTS